MNTKILFFLSIILIGFAALNILLLSSQKIPITGFAGSGTQYVSFNISEEVSVLVTGSVNFGEGRVYANASEATVQSDLGHFFRYDWVNITPESELEPYENKMYAVYHRAWEVFIILDSGGVTWQYNASDNSWLNLTDEHPAHMYEGAMVYDSSVEEVILFGGTSASDFANETWKFNSSKQWERLYPAQAPSARDTWPGMAFDSKRNVSVLFGGFNRTIVKLNDTWEYNASSNTWTEITPENSPPAMMRLRMAFDSNRNVTVLFGGQTDATSSSNETWEYNGSTWVERTDELGEAPPGRRLNAITFDSERNKMVMFGGVSGGSFVNDTWEYDGTGWSEKNEFQRAIITYLAFDNNLNKMLMFGGDGSSSSIDNNEVWEYNTTEVEFNGSINGSWYFERSWFSIENDGTVNISIEYQADNNADVFIGGTNPEFKIKGIEEETGACPELNTTFAEVPNSSQASNTICPLLKFENYADSFKVPVKLLIPDDISPGNRTATITFSASTA